MVVVPSYVGGCCCRDFNQSLVEAAINVTVKLRAQFPTYLLGFDLVGCEDMGHPLVYFIDELLYWSQMGVDLPYFFHAGETGEQHLYCHVNFHKFV